MGCLIDLVRVASDDRADVISDFLLVEIFLMYCFQTSLTALEYTHWNKNMNSPWNAVRKMKIMDIGRRRAVGTPAVAAKPTPQPNPNRTASDIAAISCCLICFLFFLSESALLLFLMMM